MNIYEGKLVSEGIKVGVVCARFNEFIVSKLLSGCEDALLRHGVDDADISVAWVPGAFEIPLIASKLAQSGKVRRRHRPGRRHPGPPPATMTTCAARSPRALPRPP